VWREQRPTQPEEMAASAVGAVVAATPNTWTVRTPRLAGFGSLV
jgi:hypothetical protein